MQKTLKICVDYHKPSLLLNGECFMPVWGGKAIVNSPDKECVLSQDDISWLQNNCVGDDTGDNISLNNDNYCEMTILYWMWKNYDKLGNPDFIGFLKYCCHWVLKDDYLALNKPNVYNLVVDDVFSRDYQYKIGCTEQNILRLLEKADGLFCVSDTDKNIYSFSRSHQSQYAKYLDKVLDIIEKDWSQYAKYAREFISGKFFVGANCFVMRREDFFEYCPFLFDILAKIHEQAKSEHLLMTEEQMHITVYVSEIVLGIWWVYLLKQNKNIRSAPVSYITNPENTPFLGPKFIRPTNDSSIPIVFIADNNYIKYIAVAIQSLIANVNSQRNYDVIVLNAGNIDKNLQKQVMEMAIANVSIRFFNANYYINHYAFDRFFHKRLNLVPYLKLFIHKILQGYDKAIFLDGDLVVLKDIAEFYDLDLEGNLIGAIIDPVVVHVKTPFWESRRDYILTNNKMSDVNQYFNTGVILLDIKNMQQNSELINLFINEARFFDHNRIHHDQDVFNFVLEGKVKKFSARYNWHYCLYQKIHRDNLPVSVKTECDEIAANNDIHILHFDGDDKPWRFNLQPNDSTILWWKYAKMTPFYEEFIHCYKRELNNSIFKLGKSYFVSEILSKLLIGAKRKHYEAKRSLFKQQLKNIKSLLDCI